MAFGFEAPLTANARMQDLLQRAFLFRVGKDYGAKLPPVQVAARRINRRAKFMRNEFPHFQVALRQIARGLIRIKKCRGGKEPMQTLAKGCLTGGDSARNSNSWHV